MRSPQEDELSANAVKSPLLREDALSEPAPPYLTLEADVDEKYNDLLQLRGSFCMDYARALRFGISCII